MTRTTTLIALLLVAALGGPSLAWNLNQEKGETLTVGEIMKLDVERRTIEVRSKIIGVVLARSSSRINATVGETVTLEDLRRRLPGESVRPIRASSAASVTRPDPGYTKTIFLTDDKTAFSYDGEEISFDLLEVGQRVKITAKPAGDDKLALKVDRSS